MLKRLVLGLPLVLGMTTMFAGVATATTLTFEGSSNTIYSAPITRSGFVIGNAPGEEQHFHEIDSTAFPNFVPNDGTGVLYNDRNTTIVVTTSGLSTFTAGTVDVATDLNGGAGGSSSLTIDGFLNNLLVNSISVNLNQAGSYSLVNLAGLGLIDRLVFDGIPTTGNGGFTLDNLNVTPAAAPEPSTISLFSLVTVSCGTLFYRKRRQA